MKRVYVIMGLLVVLFMAPGMIAYVVYLHPTWLSNKTNHGTLLQPPRLLSTQNNRKKSNDKKWQILYWSPQGCEQRCIQRLDDLARMRLALGRRLYYVDLILAVNKPLDSMTASVQAVVHKMDAHLVQMDASQLGPEPAVYLVNPQQYVILSYTSDQSVQDIFHDLQKMVRDT